jgi:hypothetical protein
VVEIDDVVQVAVNRQDHTGRRWASCS